MQSIVVRSWKVITTRKDATAILQHANTVIVLIFCILYSSLYHGHGVGLFAWLVGLLFMYGVDRAQNPDVPEFDLRTRKILSALAGWFCSILTLGLFLDKNDLLLIDIIPFILLAVLYISYWKRLSHTRFNLAVVLRGDIRILKEIEDYIQKNYVNNNLVDLVDPAYSKESLCIINESEWRSVAEFKKKGLLTSLREKELNREHTTFSCLLRGEWRHLDALKYHIIDRYLLDRLDHSFNFVYSRDRLYMIGKPEWEAYKDLLEKS